jgi:hypothetical protein
VTTVDDCRIIDLPKIAWPEGNITPVESDATIPFPIRRVFYLYDVVGGADRGGHSHHELQQLIIAVMGGFSVVVDDGERRERFELNRAYRGLYVPPMVWSQLLDFTSGAVCVVLASQTYNEPDYIRDYDTFLAHRSAMASA